MSIHDSRTPRRVFLTGASRGIGLHLATELSKRGYQVWGTARNISRLPVLPGFHPVELDLSDDASMHQAFAAASAEARGGFDVLVNNAGDGIFGPFEALADDPSYRAQFQVHLFGPSELMRLALPYMRGRHSGSIVNISSLAVDFPLPFMSAYSAAKAALSALSEAMRLELASSGVHVVDVRLGDIATQMLALTPRLQKEVNRSYEPAMANTWKSMEKEMARTVTPQQAAQVLARVIGMRRPPPVIRYGNFFQARLAVLAAKLLPRRVLHAVERKMYGI